MTMSRMTIAKLCPSKLLVARASWACRWHWGLAAATPTVATAYAATGTPHCAYASVNEPPYLRLWVTCDLSRLQAGLVA